MRSRWRGALLFTLTDRAGADGGAAQAPAGRQEKHPPFLTWLQDRYLGGLRVTMRRPFMVALVGGWR